MKHVKNFLTGLGIGLLMIVAIPFFIVIFPFCMMHEIGQDYYEWKQRKTQ